MTVKTTLKGLWGRVTRAYTHDEIQERISETYRDMRLATFVVAATWPLVLWWYGSLAFDIELQGSMSAYYHTSMRNWFVGVCFIIGVLLFVYKGFSPLENRLLDFAGVCAVLVAIFPTSAECVLTCFNCRHEAITPYTNTKVHGAAAMVFFACCATVCAVESRHTLPGHPRKDLFKRLYVVLGAAMFIAPLAILAVLLIIPDAHGALLFGAELGAVEVFAFYWLVKTWEIGSFPPDPDQMKDVQQHPPAQRFEPLGA